MSDSKLDRKIAEIICKNCPLSFRFMEDCKQYIPKNEEIDMEEDFTCRCWNSAQSVIKLLEEASE
jgi:hypothetical protein